MPFLLRLVKRRRQHNNIIEIVKLVKIVKVIELIKLKVLFKVFN